MSTRRSALAGLLASLSLSATVGCGPPQAQVQQTFSVVHTSPHHGAVEVSPGVAPIVAFSVPITSGGLDEIQIQERTDGGYARLEAFPFLGDEGLTVRLIPRRHLDPETEHRIYVGPDVLASDGSLLGAQYTARFFTGVE